MGDKGDSTPSPSTTPAPVAPVSTSAKTLKAEASEFVPGAYKGLTSNATAFVPGGNSGAFVPPYNTSGGNYPQYQQGHFQQFYPPGNQGGYPSGGRGRFNQQQQQFNGMYPQHQHQQQFMYQQQQYMPMTNGAGMPMIPIPPDVAQPVGPDGAVISNQDPAPAVVNGGDPAVTANAPAATATTEHVAEKKEPAVAEKLATAAPVAAAAAPEVAVQPTSDASAASGAAAASEWGRAKKDKEKADMGDTSKQEKGEKSGWSRGEKIANPDNFKKDDGKLRYDKVAMFTVYKPHSYCIPQRVKEYYEKFGIHERCPLGYEPFRKAHRGGDHSYMFSKEQANNVLENDYKEEAAAMFSAEKLKQGFHYDPNRLSTSSADDHAAQITVTTNKANLTLNKLSVEKFDKLSDEFLSLGLHQEEELMNKTVDMIVKKAQLQQPFAFMYANLCQKITSQWSEITVEGGNTGDDNADDEKAEKEANTYGKLFRSKLLSRCQQEFSVDRAAALEAIRNDPNIADEDREEKETILKMKFNGHMRFVGEIYMHDLIKSSTMVLCLKEFLQTPDEQNLVCMVKLFETLGKKLEDYYVARKKTRHFAEIFENIQGLLENKELTMTSRMRYLLKDLIDLRASNWVPRIKALKATTKAEIQKEADVANGVAGGKTSRPGSTAPTPGNKHGMSVSSSFGDVRDAGNRSPKPQSPMRNTSDNNEESGWSTVAGKKKEAPKARAGAGNDVRGSKTAGKPGFGSAIKPEEKGKGSAGKPKPTKGAKDDKARGKGSSLCVDTEGGAPSGESEGAFTPAVTHRVGHVPEEIASKLKSAANEFIGEPAAVEDVCDDLKKLFTANDQLPSGAVKWFLNYVMDKQDSHRSATADLLHALVSRNLVSSDALVTGIYLFLNDSEDTILDNPQLLSYLALIVARCFVVHKIVALTIFASIPEENAFHSLSRDGDLWAALLHQVGAVGGLELAKEQYKELALDFSQYIICGPREDKKEALDNFLKKHKIDDIVV